MPCRDRTQQLGCHDGRALETYCRIDGAGQIMAGLTSHGAKWRDFLNEGREYVAECDPMPPSGHLTKVTGLVMEAVGLKMPVGSTCAIHLPNNVVEAEVVGFSGERVFLMPENDVYGLVPGARVMPIEPAHMLTLGGNAKSMRRRVAEH